MRSSLTLLFPPCLLLLACTGSAHPDASLDAPLAADAGPLSIQEYCTRAVNAAVQTVCGYRGRCCTALEQSQLAPVADAVPLTFSCTMGTPDAWITACVQSLQGTTAVYDPAAARTCVEGLESISGGLLCNGPDPWYGIAVAEPVLLACAQAACPTGRCMGTLGVGELCTADADCAHDAFCAPDASGDGSTGAMHCRYRLQSGESCRVDGLGLNAAPDCRSRACDHSVCIPRCIGPR